MQRSTLFGLIPFALAAAAITTSLFAEPSRVYAPERAADGVLHEAMESMNSAMRAFSKGVDASNRDKCLESVVKIQAAILTSKAEKPDEVEKVEEAKRAEFLAGYRRMMAELLVATGELEIALLDNKFDVANSVVKDKLQRLKKEGHDKYQGEEEKH